MTKTCKFFCRVFFKDVLCFQRIVQKKSGFIVLCFKCKISSRTEAPDQHQTETIGVTPGEE